VLGAWDDGIFVVLDPGKQALQDRREDKSQDGSEDGGEDGPWDEGVALPEPELANECERGRAGRMQEFAG